MRASYVRRRADDVLYDTIAGGRYAHVIAPDRSGWPTLKNSPVASLFPPTPLDDCSFELSDMLESRGMR